MNLMRHLVFAALPLIVGCGSDPCAGLDPEIHVFWTDEQKEVCPWTPRPSDPPRRIAAAVTPPTEPSYPSPPSCEGAQNLTACR